MRHGEGVTIFPMERKLIIVIVCLAAGLIAGGFALAWKNKDVFLAAAKGNAFNQTWIQIKPRTDDAPTVAVASASKTQKTKSSSPAAKKSAVVNQTGPKSASLVKEPIPQIVWCPIPAAKVKVPAAIINEVVWMGTQKSHTDEWVELKNLFHDSVDIGGWQLQNKNQGIKVSLKPGSVVPAGGFYLLERTDDTTVPAVSADAIYTGNLANANDALYLFDASCQLQDSVVAASAWPAGDNASKRTMERTGDLLWRTSIAPGGTPKQENSVY
jgi:hypothetical protein